MALARAVSFEGVDEARMAEMTRRMTEEGRPDDLPATEMVVLHDAAGQSALVVLFFDSEEDYRQGDEVLNSMPADETPGRRASVTKYDVALRMTG